MAQRTYSGRTEDAGAPILGARFWKKGITLSGRVIRDFPTANGPCYELELDKELSVPGEKVSPEQDGKVIGTHFSIGNMKGFGMALAAAGIDRLQSRDRVKITCVGESKSGKASPRVDFEVAVTRDEF